MLRQPRKWAGRFCTYVAGRLQESHSFSDCWGPLMRCSGLVGWDKAGVSWSRLPVFMLPAVESIKLCRGGSAWQGWTSLSAGGTRFPLSVLWT